jgi:hypothetical protein
MKLARVYTIMVTKPIVSARSLQLSQGCKEHTHDNDNQPPVNGLGRNTKQQKADRLLEKENGEKKY